MNIIKNITIVLLAAFILSSCSTTLYPFTNEMYDDFGGNEEALSKIQFYLSRDIVLYKDYGGTKSSIENGTIKIVDGRKIEEIIFEEGTPGVFIFSPKTDRIAVSFEEGEDKYLMFGPSEKVKGRFVLLGKEWKNRRGKITYAGETWNTTDASAYASLLVDVDKARKTQMDRVKASGRKI